MVRLARRVIVFIILGAIVNVLVAWGLAYRPDPDGPITYTQLGETFSRETFLHDERNGYTQLITINARAGEEQRRYARHASDDPLTKWNWPTAQSLDDPDYLVPLTSWTSPQPPLAISARSETVVLNEQANGWPFRSLAYSYTHDLGQMIRSGVQGRDDSRGLLVLPDWMCFYTEDPNESNQIIGYGGLTTVTIDAREPTRLLIPYFPLWAGFIANTVFYALLFAVPFYGFGITRRALRRWRGRCPRCAYPTGTSPVCTECGRPLR